ncbi:MAG: PAS domain S-box protein [Candidatus Helarchaeota archaeon]
MKEFDKFLQEYHDNAPVPFFFIDNHGNIISANEAAEDFIGYNLEELKKKKVFELYSKESLKKAKELFTLFKKGIPFKNEEMIYKKKNGEKAYGLLSVNPIKDKNGHVLKSYSIIIDITERKKAERELINTKNELQEALEFAGFYQDILIHNINNLVQNILFSIQDCSELTKEGVDCQKIRDTLLILKDEIKKCSNLISNVQRLSKIKEGGTKVERKDILKILKQSIQLITRIHHDKKINVKLDTQDDELFVNASDFLNNLFENILLNAVVHNENPIVEILIKISKVRKNDQNFLKFEFIDNGIGIPDSRKKLIFEKGNLDEKNVYGMGIGLFLSNKIVKAHNGLLWIEDRVLGDYKKGSNFVLMLPEA